MGSSGYKSEKKKIIDPEMITASKSICKISTSYKIASGFFIKLFKNDQDFFCLMTNETIITKEMIEKEEKINLYYDSEKLVKEIILTNERFIKEFTDIGIDETIVEILPEDNIDKDYFLLPVIDYIYDYIDLLNKEIILIQNQIYFTGKIKKINNYEFNYLTNKEFNSTGSPIFLKDNIKVIGICKNNKDTNKISENIGDFIGPIFNYFKKFEVTKEERKNDNKENEDLFFEQSTIDLIDEDKSIEKEIECIENTDEPNDGNGNFINGKLEGNGKFIWENGNYYIGQFKNGKKHGKGIIYFKDGNIAYEGDFFNDKKEGTGKLILKNGLYYEGQFKKGRKNGKGKIYNKNGNIIYEGDFSNDKKEGNGKLIIKKGHYYEGQFKNNKINGKGIYYYNNGNIMYDGDFVNGKFEGSGKFVWKNGQYYIGQFKNGKRNGKGIEYYKNGNIMYEGDYVNGKYEGNGKFVWKNGQYYVGEFKNGKGNGKGIVYYKNGNIKCTSNID